MSIRSRSSGILLFAVTLVCAVLAASSVLAVPVMFSGTMRQIVRTGQVPNVPPAATIPTFSGVLNVTPSGGITVPANQANFATNYVVTNPPTFAGVLQQTSFLTVMNPHSATAKPGNGPGPFTFAYPSPTGGAPLDPTLGVSKRLGAVSAAAGPANFGGTFPFLFNFVANLVFFGGGGGNPNLACPNGVAGEWGQTFVFEATASCVGLTTGPLPAMTLPSVMVPQHVSLNGFPATTGNVFAAAPAPVATTTITAVGSDVRNTAGTTGMIQLVAPALFAAQLGGSANLAGQNNAALITEFTLTLMPEPGALIALFGGIAGLVGLRVLERRRRG